MPWSPLRQNTAIHTKDSATSAWNSLTSYSNAGGDNLAAVALNVWDTGTLTWVKGTGTGGGGGGAVTVADGADTAEGSTTDAAVYGDVSGTISAKLRGISAMTRGNGTANAPTYSQVITSGNLILANNANRKSLVIVNIGPGYVSFGLGTTAQLYYGITLLPNGVWVMKAATFTTGAIFAISSVTSILSIQEFQ